MSTLEEILAQLGVSGIDITYEDGLRLSELSGKLAQAQFDLSHVMTTHAGDIVMPTVLTLGLLMMFAAMVSVMGDIDRGIYDVRTCRELNWSIDGYISYDDLDRYIRHYFHNDEEAERVAEHVRELNELKARAGRSMFWPVYISISIAVTIAVLFVCYCMTVDSLYSDIASYTAQMEAIVDRYGVVS